MKTLPIYLEANFAKKGPTYRNELHTLLSRQVWYNAFTKMKKEDNFLIRSTKRFTN